MGKSKIQSLKSIAGEIASATSEREQLALLTQGFELFSEETERLDQAYATLKDQFRTVNSKLEETNDRLANKVQELHALTGYLDNILSHMAQGLIFIDLEGHITTYNQAAEHILEIPRDQVLFQPYSDHFPDDWLGFSLKKILKEKKTPKVAYTSFSFSDGRIKELEAELTFIPQKERGSPLIDFTQGLIILIRDITEFRRLQTLASRNDRMKALGEMAAQVAHEIRNPLGGIKGFAALLERDLKKHPEQLKLSQNIIEGSNILDRLVTQVLNYSRPLQVELQPTDLKQTIEELEKALVAEKAIPSNVVLKLNLPLDIIAPVDSAVLKLALKNLMINAIQAMPDGGALSVDLCKMDHKAIIKINDTGIGIPKEHLKKLFSPFFSTKSYGNGLGLAEANKVIQAHGGEISAESTPGKGTTFTIKLPLKI